MSLQRSIQTPVAASAAGTTTIVPAVAGANIRVVSAILALSVAGSVKLQSHTSTANATGAIPLAANGQLILPYNEDGWFTTSTGEALDLTVAGTTPVLGGSLNYVVI